jgi:chemotaxis protein CheZ
MQENLAEQLLSRFMKLREEKGETIDVGDAAMLISDLTDLMEKQNKNNKENIYSEIRDISEKIQSVRQEIAENLPDGVVPEATEELDAVVKSTEDATNRILDAADNIRNIASSLGDPGVVGELEKEIVNIFEACNFQDITGQRIKKVTNVLQYIEKSLSKILVNFDSQKKVKKTTKKSLDQLQDKDLMNGPQLDQKAPSQADVDKLFDSV